MGEAGSADALAHRLGQVEGVEARPVATPPAPDGSCAVASIVTGPKDDAADRVSSARVRGNCRPRRA